MNELIQQLAGLSGFKVDWQHEDVQALKMARFEKFAELIVKECVTIMTDASDSKLRLSDAIWNTKIHFGVEE